MPRPSPSPPPPPLAPRQVDAMGQRQHHGGGGGERRNGSGGRDRRTEDTLTRKGDGGGNASGLSGLEGRASECPPARPPVTFTVSFALGSDRA